MLILLLAAFSALLVALMVRVGALDHPVARSSHQVATPKGGGVGIAGAFAAGTLWLVAVHAIPASVLMPLAAALFLAVVSFVDDVRPGPFIVKLAAQLAASLIAIAAGDCLSIIAIGGHVVHLPAAIAVPLTVGWFLFVTNAVNFMDGLNGLASGAILIAGVALAVVAPSPMRAESLPLSAGIAGFLPFNYPRARIFMGDVGSQLCGFVAAGLAVRAASSREAALLVPLALLPLLADAAFTLLRRLGAGERVTQAHRGHLYQVAHRSGMSAVRVAAVYWAMSGWGALCGVAAGQIGNGTADVTLSLVLAAVPMIGWLGYVAAKAKRAGITHW